MVLAQDPPESAVPFSLTEAISKMTYPEGFNVTLFAGEPQVVQPIAMTTDARGRVWVVESLQYPEWQRTNGPGKDRVVILEDADGDGKADSRKVFLDTGRNLTSVAVGMGGVWLCATPELVFVPDLNNDDKPDGPAEVLLDGWDLNAQHNAFNGLTWGPDGWLYGCNGILSNSKVGKPGSAENERVSLNCGVWRYHPTRKVFEVVAHGTTNPWGIAFDENGQIFVANCVIKHLFHMVPGGRYERMFGQDLNPYAFKLIESCANHIHWAGGFWKTEGAESPRNDTAGGGHAHCGAMIYLGDNWPQEYRGGFYTLNVHGHRINHDLLQRVGSTYVAHHTNDVLKANDSWFRGVSLMYGADGGVYMSDWTDAGECHDYEDIHKENGRIYKITHSKGKALGKDLRQSSDQELLRYLFHRNEWFGAQARLVLQERAATGRLEQGTVRRLAAMMKEEEDPARALRLLWALHAAGGLEKPSTFFGHSSEYVRAWAVQLATQTTGGEEISRGLINLARNDRSPVVRLYLASALQRESVKRHAVELARNLVGRGEDAADGAIPLLLWYGIEPIVSSETDSALRILESARIPLVRQFIAQRLALRMELDALTGAMAASDPAAAADLANGMFQALNGRRQIAMPGQWRAAARKLQESSSREAHDHRLRLGLIFGDAEAERQLRTTVADRTAAVEKRRDALDALFQARAPGVLELLQSSLKDAAVRLVAIRGLAAFDHPQNPTLLIENYGQFARDEQTEAITTLSTRADYAVRVLEAVKAGKVPAKDITPFSARQMLAHKDERIARLLPGIVGETRAVSKDRAEKIAQYKNILTKERLSAADVSNGRALYNKVCGACHTLFGEGGKLAPELTGSQRSSLDYILESVVDPNAVVWNQYKATYFETSDDRLISGVVQRENESTVTIQTQTGAITLPRSEITSRTESNLSIMPEGLFDTLEEKELLDLVAYLQSPTQVPLPKQ